MTIAEILASHRQAFKGNVKFIFQPAEETIGGAKAMIEAGVLAEPKADAIFALHFWNPLPLGQVGVRPGPVFASADEIGITIKGKGGHGALPHQTVDSIVIAGQVITALQTIVSRETPPLQPAVVTIGSVQGGSAFNIIAEEVKMTGTVRAFEVDFRDNMLRRIEEIVRGITSGMRAQYDFWVRYGCPPVVNHPQMTQFISRVAASVVGESNVVTIEPIMGGDDMAFFLEQVPGCYFLIGSSNAEQGLDKPHHSPQFNFDDERALPVATEVMTRAVLDYLAGSR